MNRFCKVILAATMAVAGMVALQGCAALGSQAGLHHGHARFGAALGATYPAAQQTVNCATNTPCTTSGPSGTGTGDQTWLAFGKVNGNESLLFNMFGSGSHLAGSGSATAGDIIGLFSGTPASGDCLGSLGGIVPCGGGSGSGTVTSVTLQDGSSLPIYAITGSPCTTTCDLTFTLSTEQPHYAFMGPASGSSAAQPTFRALVSGDIPAVNLAASGNGGVTGLLSQANGGTGTASPGLTAGANITITGSWPNQTISSTGGASASFQVNNVALISSSTINFENSAAFNGLTLTFTNPSAGNIQLGVSGTLGNAGLTYSSMTINGQNVSLGGTGNVNNGAPQFSIALNGGAGAAIGGITLPGSTGTYCINYASLTANPTFITCPGAGGGISSIGLSTTATWLTVGNSPLTANGTLTLNPTTGQTANEFVATPNGSAGAVSLRAIASADLPGTIAANTSGTAANVTATSNSTLTTLSALSLPQSQVTGLGGLATVTPGTGVATALAVNVGSAGAVVTNGGALGTPASGVATNLTGTAAGLNVGGTAGNLSGTPALPNGTSATTQTTGDNTTKLATDAFVLANAGGISGANNTVACNVSGSSGALTACTPQQATSALTGGVPNTQSGASYTLAATDAGSTVAMSSASANTATIPNSSTVTFATGNVVTIKETGAGPTAIALAGGVTLTYNGALNPVTLGGQGGFLQVQYQGSNVWSVLQYQPGYTKFVLSGTCTTLTSQTGDNTGGTAVAAAGGASCTIIVTPGGGLTARDVWTGTMGDTTQPTVPIWVPTSANTTSVTFTVPAAVAAFDGVSFNVVPH